MTAWTFHTFMSLNIENGDLGTEMGTQKLNKVPMGTRSLKWEPTWPQCKHNVWPVWTVSCVISSAKQHRWPSVMRRPRVRNWWQKIPGSRSKGVKYTWIEAWYFADKILLEALNFLQITSSQYEVNSSLFPSCSQHILCAYLGMYMCTYSPASFCKITSRVDFGQILKSLSSSSFPHEHGAHLCDAVEQHTDPGTRVGSI